MRRSGARGHRADFQRNQRGGPRRRLANASAARADLPPSPAAPCFHHRDLYPEGMGWGGGEKQCHGPERDGKRGKEKEGRREKAGTSCSSRLVQAASRRQPKGMGNVCAALSGLHELYMTCYVKMLPVYCVSCSFLPPPHPPLFFFFFNPLPPSLFLSAFKSSKFALLSSDKVFPGC